MFSWGNCLLPVSIVFLYSLSAVPLWSTSFFSNFCLKCSYFSLSFTRHFWTSNLIKSDFFLAIEIYWFMLPWLLGLLMRHLVYSDICVFVCELGSVHYSFLCCVPFTFCFVLFCFYIGYYVSCYRRGYLIRSIWLPNVSCVSLSTSSSKSGELSAVISSNSSSKPSRFYPRGFLYHRQSQFGLLNGI